MRLTFCLAVALGATVFARAANAQDAKAPELLVSLAPAGRFLPLALEKEPAVYRFQVVAVDPTDSHKFVISANTLVQPGQSRKVLSRHNDWKLEGVVTLAEGTVTYRVQLFRLSDCVSSSSASLLLKDRK